MPKKIIPEEEPDEFPIEEERTLPYYCYPHTVTRSQADIDSFNVGTALFNGWPAPTIDSVLDTMDNDASLAEMIEALEQARLL